ncbi:MAG: 3'-5' exonuclease [Pseudonocardiaceae bacterium]
MTAIDPELLQTTFVTIDFETLTPAGRRPEPTEVAAQARSLHADGTWTEVGRFEALIRPPDGVPVTSFDANQTGITAAMLERQEPAETVLGNLDKLLTRPPYVLVAQSATYEAGLLYDRATACPILARIPLIDTVRLARIAYPDLPRHRLDDLLRHLELPPPIGRHRAMPDVEATSEVFARLLADGTAAGHWRTLRRLHEVGGIVPKAVRDDEEAAKPQQQSLF